MKKRYVTPAVEIIVFETQQNVLAGDGYDFSIGDNVSGPGHFGGNGIGDSYAPNGTVVNNNGAPTFVPGGNGGGGRQTPLG